MVIGRSREYEKFVTRALGVGAVAYAALFAVFFFDLDGKFLFNVFEPFVKNHYDNMERKDMLKMPYDIDKYPAYKYDEV